MRYRGYQGLRRCILSMHKHCNFRWGKGDAIEGLQTSHARQDAHCVCTRRVTPAGVWCKGRGRFRQGPRLPHSTGGPLPASQPFPQSLSIHPGAPSAPTHVRWSWTPITAIAAAIPRPLLNHALVSFCINQGRHQRLHTCAGAGPRPSQPCPVVQPLRLPPTARGARALRGRLQ